MPKMTDMGFKYPETEAQPASPSNGDRKTHYPTLFLSDKVPDDLMGKEIGAMCRIEIVAKVTSKGINESGKKKSQRMDLEIHKMGLIGKAGKATKKEYIEMNDDEKRQYDMEDLQIDDEG